MATSESQRSLVLTRGRRVDPELLRWRATTSGGPGGQHANRSASRIEVAVRIEDLPIDAGELLLLRERLSSRITADGWVSASSQDSRHQLRNKSIALARLQRLLTDALTVAAPRVPTKMSRGAKLRARAKKEQQSQSKSSRSWRWHGSD